MIRPERHWTRAGRSAHSEPGVTRSVVLAGRAGFGVLGAAIHVVKDNFKVTPG